MAAVGGPGGAGNPDPLNGIEKEFAPEECRKIRSIARLLAKQGVGALIYSDRTHRFQLSSENEIDREKVIAAFKSIELAAEMSEDPYGGHSVLINLVKPFAHFLHRHHIFPENERVLVLDSRQGKMSALIQPMKPSLIFRQLDDDATDTFLYIFMDLTEHIDRDRDELRFNLRSYLEHLDKERDSSILIRIGPDSENRKKIESELKTYFSHTLLKKFDDDYYLISSSLLKKNDQD